MSNRLHRDLLTVRRLLEESATWRLTPAQWDRVGRLIDDLARYLVALDEREIDAVLRQFEEIEPGSRAVIRIDDPRRVPVPELIRTRIVELVPVIVEPNERLGVEQPGGNAHRRGCDAR